jgi:hypothetical protein
MHPANKVVLPKEREREKKVKRLVDADAYMSVPALV